MYTVITWVFNGALKTSEVLIKFWWCYYIKDLPLNLGTSKAF